MSGGIIIGLFLLLMLTGLPIAVSMIVPSAVYLLVNNIPISAMIQRIVGSLNSFPLLAVPLFILAANLMNDSGTTTRLFDFAKLLVGRMRGGLAQVNVIANLIFAGISGAALADIGGLGSIEIDAMTEQGYSKEASASITAAAATLGPIFPPSIPLIIYASAAETSSMKLLISGVVPALIIALFLMLQVSFFARKHNYPRGVERRFTRKEAFTIIKRGMPAMIMPAILLGGMLSGYFSPTEVAAIAIVYALFLSVVYKTFSVKRFISVCKDTLKTTAAVLFIMGASAIFAWTLAVEQVPQQISMTLLGISHNPAILLLIANVILLIAGMFLETTAAIMIITPILLPTLLQAGISPVHFGLVMVFNLMIGMLTPPVGMSVYMLSPIVGLPVSRVFRAVMPYLVSLGLALVVLTYVPQLSLWLPNLLYH
jgi:tripartite ATP-independent transporter DctM subunit